MTYSENSPKIKPSAVVTTLPLLLGPANTVAAIGLPYRWLRDTADYKEGVLSVAERRVGNFTGR